MVVNRQFARFARSAVDKKLVADIFFKNGYFLLEIEIDFNEGLNFSACMHNGGVIFTAELGANLRKRRTGKFFTEIHRYLSRIGKGFSAARGF
jgi:hypothetical protein